MCEKIPWNKTHYITFELNRILFLFEYIKFNKENMDECHWYTLAVYDAGFLKKGWPPKFC